MMIIGTVTKWVKSKIRVSTRRGKNLPTGTLVLETAVLGWPYTSKFSLLDPMYKEVPLYTIEKIYQAGSDCAPTQSDPA